jgi:hypothetical protein
MDQTIQNSTPKAYLLVLLAVFLVPITSVLPVCCNINPGKRAHVQDQDDGVKGHGVHEKAARTVVLV